MTFLLAFEMPDIEALVQPLECDRHPKRGKKADVKAIFESF
jgi:hypothetical protein